MEYANMEKERPYHTLCSKQKQYWGVCMGRRSFFFDERLKGFETDNGVIRLKLDQEIPFSLISDIAKWRFTMDQMS